MTRKIVLTCSLLLSLNAIAMSDSAPPGGPDRGPPMDVITKALQLRPEQVASVRAILIEQHAARVARHQHAEEQAQRETLARMKEVLDDKQLNRFEAFSVGMQTGHRPPPPHR